MRLPPSVQHRPGRSTVRNPFLEAEEIQILMAPLIGRSGSLRPAGSRRGRPAIGSLNLVPELIRSPLSPGIALPSGDAHWFRSFGTRYDRRRPEFWQAAAAGMSPPVCCSSRTPAVSTVPSAGFTASIKCHYVRGLACWFDGLPSPIEAFPGLSLPRPGAGPEPTSLPMSFSCKVAAASPACPARPQ